MDTSRKDYIYRKLEELKQAIDMDSYNLSRNSHDAIDFKLNELKKTLDEQYAKVFG